MLAPTVIDTAREAPAPLETLDTAPLARELELYLSFVDDARAPLVWRPRGRRAARLEVSKCSL